MKILNTIILIFTIILPLKGSEQISGNLFIDPTQQLIKKNSLPGSIKDFIEKKLNLKLTENDILADVNVVNCSCHNFSCPAFPKYLPLSLFIEKNKDGSFKFNSNGTLKFKNENEKLSLNIQEKSHIVKATLSLNHLKSSKELFENILSKLYLSFEKQNRSYAESFKNSNKEKLLIAKLSYLKNLKAKL